MSDPGKLRMGRLHLSKREIEAVCMALHFAVDDEQSANCVCMIPTAGPLFRAMRRALRKLEAAND